MNLAADGQPQEADERDAVEYLEFDLVVGEVVQRLQHEYFEHHHRVVALGACGGLAVFVADGFEFRSEDIPVDDLVESGKRVAVFIDFIETKVDVEESVDHGNTPYLLG